MGLGYVSTHAGPQVPAPAQFGVQTMLDVALGVSATLDLCSELCVVHSCEVCPDYHQI